MIKNKVEHMYIFLYLVTIYNLAHAFTIAFTNLAHTVNFTHFAVQAYV